ncbi:zonular occludens toxin domain-containing protein [Dyella humicola]|uniref:zonular occludens toxin domain-containing protein n=1 Tax=Dyella humicola TaxID=2992126 RepID=UPI002257498C|nr:zonular occludens toxin domain-containing protein [Dyella humicola]
MLYLFTGTPGSGKTLSAMEFIEQQQKENPDRIIYSANITGMRLPGVVPLDDEGVLSWHEHCEKNSLIVVDEAQRYWRAQRSGEPSKAIIEMETHRHDGIDIVMMTQHPTFLHANIRKLINVHVHLSAYTKTSALRWEWRECHDDVQDNALRNEGGFSEWHYPARLYEFYDSATMHTKRAKRPLKQVLGRLGLAFAGLVALGGLGWFAWAIHDYQKNHAGKLTEAPSTPQAQASPFSGSAGSKPNGYATTREYVAAQMPRVITQPWSAPLYDGQAVTQHPQIFCASEVKPGKCRCITEQGTRYVMEEDVCRDIVENGGAYDPFKPDRRRDDVPPPQPSQQAAGAIGQATPVVMESSGWKTGVGPDSYQPPGSMPWNADPWGSKR